MRGINLRHMVATYERENDTPHGSAVRIGGDDGDLDDDDSSVLDGEDSDYQDSHIIRERATFCNDDDDDDYDDDEANDDDIDDEQLFDEEDDVDFDQSNSGQTRTRPRRGRATSGRLYAPRSAATFPTARRPARKVEPSPFQVAVASARSLGSFPDDSPSVSATLRRAYTEAAQAQACRNENSGLRSLVELLQGKTGNAITIKETAWTIKLLCKRDAAARVVCGQYGAVEALLKSATEVWGTGRIDRVPAVTEVVAALENVLRGSEENVRAFEMAGGAQRIAKVAASDKLENDPTVALHALAVLAELKFHPLCIAEEVDATRMPGLGGAANDDRNGPNSAPAARIVSESGISDTAKTMFYVLKTMDMHSHRKKVQECGLDALRTLIGRAESGAMSVQLLVKVSQAAVAAFKMHGESQEVQWQCLCVLCDLEEIQDGMFSVGLDVATLFGALRLVVGRIPRGNNGGGGNAGGGEEEGEEKEDTEKGREQEIADALLRVTRRAVDVAVKSSWRNPEFKETAVEADGVEAVLDALEVCEDEKEVDKICTVLRMLLDSTEGRSRMNSLDCACAILKGIETVNRKAVSVRERMDADVGKVCSKRGGGGVATAGDSEGTNQHGTEDGEDEIEAVDRNATKGRTLRAVSASCSVAVADAGSSHAQRDTIAPIASK